MKPMDAIISIVVLILLTLLNAFFSMSELAIITLNDAKIRKMAESKHKGAAKVIELVSDSSGFLATIQVGVTFAGFLSSASAASSFAGPLGEFFARMGIPSALSATIATVLVTLILSFFSLVFGELVPKKVAMQRAEQISFRVVGILLVVGKLFKPFVWLLSVCTNGVTRLLGLDPNAQQETVTEEEILMMVDVGGEKGVIEESERDMIANIFEFGDTTASEVMTHRTEVTAVEDTDTVGDVVQMAMAEGVSRIPVFHEDIDTVLGIVYVKDLLKYVGDSGSRSINVTKIMRPAYFIPKGKRLDNLFSEMTERKLQMAIVVDEYGGTSGLITMEDLIESIVGNIQDEYDNEDEDIAQVSDNCFTVDGSTPVDEISDIIGFDLPEGDYDTVAGYVLSKLEHIPAPNEHPSVTVGNVTMTVERVEDRRISKIMIMIDPKVEETDGDEKQKSDRQK